MARFTSYEKDYILGREARCFCCGNVSNGEEVLCKGASVTRIITPKSKRFAHKKCIRKMWAETDRVLTSYDETKNSQLLNHSVIIIASVDEMPYFTECGFEVKPHNAQFRKYVLDCEKNGYRSGHIVKKVFDTECGYKVIINGKEVASHDEYRRVLGK